MSLNQLIASIDAEVARILRNLFVDTCDREQLDKFMDLTSTVQPLPGDTFGYYREESDASLRERIAAELEKKP